MIRIAPLFFAVLAALAPSAAAQAVRTHQTDGIQYFTAMQIGEILFELVVDTGATATVLPPDKVTLIRDKRQLEPGVVRLGNGAEVPIERWLVPSAVIGGCQVRDVLIIALQGIALADGVLGMDAFSKLTPVTFTDDDLVFTCRSESVSAE